MPRINVNPDVEISGGFEIVKDGTYMMKIDTVEEKEGQKAPYLKWKLSFVQPKEELFGLDDQPIKGTPASLFVNTTLKAEAQFRLKELVLAAGGDWGDFDTDDMLEKEVQVKLKTKLYEGDMQYDTDKSRFIIPKAL